MKLKATVCPECGHKAKTEGECCRHRREVHGVVSWDPVKVARWAEGRR